MNPKRSKKIITFMIIFSTFFMLNGCALLELLGLGGDGQNEKPTIQFTLPTNGQTFESGADLGVVVQASDSDGSIKNVKLYINNSLVRTIDGSGPYTWGTANSSNSDNALLNLSSGNYTLKAVASDDKNESEADTINVKVNQEVPNQNPSVYFTKPTNGQTFEYGADLGVVVQASDTDGTIAKVKLYINNSLVREITGTGPYKWGTENSSNSDNALLNLSAGNYTLKAVATDDDGGTNNASISITVKAEVPNQNPTLYFSKPTNGSEFTVGSDINVVVSASDSDGSISKVELFINNQSVSVDTSSPYSWSSQNNSDNELANLAAGTYTLKAVATDDDGGKATKSISIKITSNGTGGTGAGNGPYICTKVNDGLDTYDFTYMGQKLDGLGLKKQTMDSNVSTTELKTYFGKQVEFLYHTGHGSPGLIATSNGAFYYSNVNGTIQVANTFVATCLTLKDTGWKGKFGTNTNSFSGYTNTTYDGNTEIKIIDKYISHLKNGKSYVMSFYLGHKDINVYQDRWCIYAKNGSSIVEYSARNGSVPSGRGGIVPLDDSNKLFVADSLINRSNTRALFDEVTLGQIRTRTSTPGGSILRLRQTNISQNDALQVALQYIHNNGEMEVDQALDRIIPIDIRVDEGNAAILGGWEVRFAKGMDNGLRISSNGPTMHMTVLITGNGEVISFTKRWAHTNTNRTAVRDSDDFLSITAALNIAAPEISEGIKDVGSSFVLSDWKMVYGLESDSQENSVLRPAYSFLDDSGTEVIVVDALTGKVL